MDVEKWGRECVCVCAFVSECGKGSAGQAKECVFGKGTCSLSDTEGKAKVFAFVSMGADRKANSRGGGALEHRDSRLLEDGSERGGALGPDLVPKETARELVRGSERAGACQRALTEKQTLGRGGAPQRGHGAPLEPLAELGDAFHSVSPCTLEWVDATETVPVQAAQAKERRSVNMGADRERRTLGSWFECRGLLWRLQRRVALEALGESGCSLGTEVVVFQTASRW